MKHFRNFTFLTIVLSLVNISIVYSQARPIDGLLRNFIDYRKNSLQEKLFIHSDRSLYIAGETIRFTCYYVDGHLHHPINLSKVAYLEILDKDNIVHIQTKIELNNGIGDGYIEIPSSLLTGNYVLRSYTQWMMNFSSDFYFQQPITIVNTFRPLAILPISATIPEYDIQFFPEGGKLLNGIRNKIGFRITNKEGNGIDFQGNISDAAGKSVCTFSPLKFGIGSFYITPKSGEEYSVSLKDNTGRIIHSKLPTATSSGYHLEVIDSTNTLLKILIKSAGAHPIPFLLIHNRQSILLAKELLLINGSTEVLLNKADIPEGVSHITLFDSNKQPVCERLIFKRPETELDLQITTDRKQYGEREKIILTISTSSQEKLISNLSLSVYKDDSLSQFKLPQLQHYFTLTSDLKGNIESPEFYFQSSDLAIQAADNLMLTHGWSRFIWSDVTSNPKQEHKYLAECNGPILTGTIQSTEPSTKVGRIIFLSAPGKNIQFYPAVSDHNGNFKIELTTFTGRKNIYLETKSEKDSSLRYSINDSFSKQFKTLSLPSINLPKIKRNDLIDQSIAMQVADVYAPSRTLILRNSILHDSSYFYGTPDEHYLLSDYTRFPVMEEVLREYVKGVWLRKQDGKYIFKVPNSPANSIFNDEPLVLLDGVPILNINKIMALDPLKIKQIDVLTRKYFLGPTSFSGIVLFSSFAGDMAGLTLGKELMYEYQGIQESKEFFSPRYDSHNAFESTIPDLRNTLLWAPKLKFDGKKSIQLDFFTSDQSGKYQIILQGISINGKSGSASGTINIVTKTQ